MNVNDYVRTKDGQIDKIKKISKEYYERADDEEEKLYKIYQLKNKHYDEEFDENNEWVFEDYIIKSSSSIIDLIEVGDYVNGFLVINKKENAVDIIKLMIPFELKEEDIKSVLTHKQFEEMEYRL